MGKIQILESGITILCKGSQFVPKGKINPKTLSYVPPKNNISANIDEFMYTTTTAQNKISTAPRKMIVQDRFDIRQYFLMKKMDLKISAKEFTELFAFEGEEYRLKAFELLIKKMNIPKELAPKCLYSDAINVPMMYDYGSNAIIVNSCLNVDKAMYLSLLRHELQHYGQNMQMFMHETKGVELAELFAKAKAKQSCINVDNCVKNADIEQLKSIMNEKELKEFIYLKDLIKNNKTIEYEKYMEKLEKAIYDNQKSEYNIFRQKVIEKFGILKKDTREGKRAEKMFNETIQENGYWQTDGQIHYGKYFMDCRENEALAAQEAMIQNISRTSNIKRCYLMDLKQARDALEQNNENLKLKQNLDETVQELRDKRLTVEEIIAYLYD